MAVDHLPSCPDTGAAGSLQRAGRPGAEALFFEANRRTAAGDAAGAEACLRRALVMAPDFAEALANLALLRERAGAPAEAEEYYRRSLALQPDCVQVMLNLGVLLLNSRKFSAAESIGRAAVKLAPATPAAWSNLGVLLACLKREREAEWCYRHALELDGDYSNARFNLSYVLLRQGRFEEGWQCMEARAWYAVLERHFACPRWRGEKLEGKAIVIGFEAGHGDMIQFCRYAANLKAMNAARVAVVCHPALKTLFGTLHGADEVYSFDEDVPAAGWDYWTPPLSLPYYFQTRLHDVPAPIPYLAADPALVAKWSKSIPRAGMRVGLVWQGNPEFENDADRSLPSLEMLAPLGSVRDVQFVSLQKGAGEIQAQHPPAGMSLIDLGPHLKNFADTAAAMTNLDLVISVDTAVAHLAGALGIPCWLMLPEFKTDWRWLAERTDTPWYPQRMRLFRQAAAGDWPPVIKTLAATLADVSRKNRAAA